MILTALKELAEREGLVAHPHFEVKRVAYQITVGPGGKYLGLAALGETPGKKYTGLAELVPRPLPGARRSGTTIDPAFLVDNASFVLGINAPGDAVKKGYTAEELADRQSRFHALVHEAAEATRDEGLVAVDTLLADLKAGRQHIEAPAELKSNALLAFRYYPDVDLRVHQRPAVATYWGQRRGTAEQAEEPAPAFQCLITGRECLPVEKHPLVKKVPGGTPSGISFVSFNDPVFESYGLERSENAPVSRAAADAYTEALKRLLDDAYPDPNNKGAPRPCRNFRLSEDTVVVFWGKGNDEAIDLFADSVGQGEPEAVEALYRATWKGRPINLDDPSAFYALTLSGGQGRGTIRGWLETTLGRALGNVKQYFADLKIARPKGEEAKAQPLLGLLRQTAVLGKLSNVAPHMAADLFAAVLANQPFPRAVLDAAVRRTRAERALFPDRAALLKAYLLRARRAGLLPNFPEVQIMVDESCPDRAYRLGRLFAVLEKIQQEATNASATIRDRYYGAASATPVVVFPQLLRKVPHHLPKSQRPRFYEKLVQEICDELQPPAPFPHTLTLEQQGLFAVGYYHERQALFDEKLNQQRNERFFPKAMS